MFSTMSCSDNRWRSESNDAIPVYALAHALVGVRLLDDIHRKPEQFGESLPEFFGSPKASKTTWPGHKLDRHVNIGRTFYGGVARRGAE